MRLSASWSVDNCCDSIKWSYFLFFLVHMYTYQQEFICHYSRLSSVLDMDSVISQQSLREVQLVLFSVLDRAGNSGQRHDKEAF